MKRKRKTEIYEEYYTIFYSLICNKIGKFQAAHKYFTENFLMKWRITFDWAMFFFQKKNTNKNSLPILFHKTDRTIIQHRVSLMLEVV